MREFHSFEPDWNDRDAWDDSAAVRKFHRREDAKRKRGFWIAAVLLFLLLAIEAACCVWAYRQI